MEAYSVQEILSGLPKGTQEHLKELTDVFLLENAKVNLSAHRSNDRCWQGNILDALPAIPFIKNNPMFNAQCSVLDIGTGGGFPLLPLAITFPDHRFTGMDSVQKKMDAVQRIIDTLKIANVMLVTGRAEDLGNSPAHREHYDIVTARAVAEARLLLEYCAPFVKVGGHILLWKSLDIDDEISSSKRAEVELQLRRLSPVIYDLGAQWGKRQILVYEKTARTPEAYPRPVGTAKKHTL
ncbi:16S rRNA (guanine(527)-N(7))-methyltransferase RsmG [Candidatus Peribacteria bacterium]|nr:16S rRNA (guanine(527)-N(7))-methyltransferase RsmG [Candidatus Peribacteria bacterium]